ncbi:cell division protein ZapA [Pseudoxanthomonas sangjuensis]|uniref:cell division protein ZapA n=1 Tax=Pseudoxanthomonas sangjuensis TaxID=1503750 RepID=UPI001390EB52|nr:cell division protein ZapA [Pseudoxanthomonas sangjuensis]KAF1709184.1 cell division protein ZapA [Pseudoxanthomonas sangjuensis]
MSGNEPVSVHILDREYTVGVEAGERGSLMAAAKLLDSKMREVRGSNRMAAVDRVAVLAALNLAHELQLLRDQAGSRERELTRVLEDLNHKLDRALGS